MATPINSTTASSNAPSSGGVSPVISDLLARFGVQGGSGQGPQMAFSQWMEKHGAQEQEAPPRPASDTARSSGTSSSSASQAAAKAAEQALARSRQQALMANRSLEARQAEQSAEARTSQAHAERSPAATSRKDGAGKAHKEEGAREAAPEKDDDEVTFSTAMGDGAAVVRELTPPPSIQPGDAAGMMAWLAGLTHGDLLSAKGAAGGELEEGTGTSTTALQQADGRSTDPSAIGDEGKSGKPGAFGLDNSLWQGVSASANLQTEVMLAQPGLVSEGRAEVDPMAGLLSAGIKGVGPSMGGAEGASSVRHESATLPTPLDSPDFAQALADKVSLWVGSARDDGTMTAELHLNPADMGPINVKISLDGQTAQVDFAAAALETRKAIEASLPLLSSALNDVGLNMTGGDVSSQTAQQQFGQGFAQSQGGSGRASGLAGGEGDAGSDPVAMRPVAAPRPGRLGGLDLYA
jgi:flagellar hook-length control protein FliK